MYAHVLVDVGIHVCIVYREMDNWIKRGQQFCWRMHPICRNKYIGIHDNLRSEHNYECTYIHISVRT